MAKSKRIFVQGEALHNALNMMVSKASESKVKWIVAGDSYRITAAQAICMIRALDYEGKVHKGRVYFIRAVNKQIPSTYDPSFRDDRPVLQPNPTITKRTVEIWDAFFKTHPGVTSVLHSSSSSVSQSS